MKNVAAVAFLLILTLALPACQSTQPADTTPPPAGHGAISIDVIPNPIMAKLVSGTTYDFPLEIVVRETGGRPVNVQRVTARVFLIGGFTVAQESWDADEIRKLGYATTLDANSETRFRLSPRKEVPDDRLFSSVAAELKVDVTDDTGNATSARTEVTVRR